MYVEVPKVTKVLASPIVVAINDIERAMGKLGYALYSGEVFKKAKSSKYTYHHCCSAKKFLSLLASNDQFKDTIIKNLNKLVEILGDKDCEFMKQLCINYDLIEVNGGWCFSISQRKSIKSKKQTSAKNLPGPTSTTNTLRRQILDTSKKY